MDSNVLNCSVCFQKYNEHEIVPKIYPCGHFGCSKCISAMLILNKHIACPECRKPFRTSQLSDFPTAYQLISIINELSKINIDDSTEAPNRIKYGAQHRTEDGAQNRTEDGAQNWTNDGEQNRTEDGAQNRTEDGAKNRTEDGAQNRTNDGEQNWTEDGAQNRIKDGAEIQTEISTNIQSISSTRLQSENARQNQCKNCIKDENWQKFRSEKLSKLQSTSCKQIQDTNCTTIEGKNCTKIQIQNCSKIENFHVGFCSEHSNSIRNFGCSKCKIWLCATCVIMSHKDEDNCDIVLAYHLVNQLRLSYLKQCEALMKKMCVQDNSEIDKFGAGVIDKLHRNFNVKPENENIFKKLKEIKDKLEVCSSVVELEDLAEDIYFSEQCVK